MVNVNGCVQNINFFGYRLMFEQLYSFLPKHRGISFIPNLLNSMYIQLFKFC